MASTAHREGSARRGCFLRAFSLLLGLALMIAGLGIFLWPSVAAWRTQQDMTSRIEAAFAHDAATDPDTGRRSKDDPGYAYLAAYNRDVVAGTAGSINDPFGIGSDEQALDELGLEDAIVGSIAIPSMNVQLPIYLGASSEHMALGATVISATSAPLGGTDSNCVLAAHRGEWSGVPMFRDIESIQVGDLIVVETPWDVLVYRADELKIISPSDAKSLAIQKGRDLVTLFTCHPYGYNYQRYLVICERDPEAEEAYLADEAMRSKVVGATSPLSILIGDIMRVAESCESEQLRTERILRVTGLVLFVLALIVMLRAIMRAATGKQRVKVDTTTSGKHSRSRGSHFKQ